MESATAFAVLKWIVGPIWIWWRSYSSINANMIVLNDRLKDLNCRREDRSFKMKRELVSKWGPRKRLKTEVAAWFQKVDEINKGVQGIEEEFQTPKCFSHRFGLGKLILSQIQEVERVYKEGEFPGALAEALPVFHHDTIPTANLCGETTIMRNMEEIWGCLMDNRVAIVGVFGMGGIGKTTVMKHIHNRLLEEQERFDNVIWVTASNASSVSELQEAIAREIDLDIAKCVDVTRRAAKIFAELNQRTRFVLILDDLWIPYSLEDVGIPQVTPKSECKLVLTTRDLNVCSAMNCKPIQMQFLSEGEALKLFLDTVGNDVQSNPNLTRIVCSIVKDCARLPLAIATTAGSLRGTLDYFEWCMTLEDLQRNKVINEKLKLSYYRLHDENLQSCFLYCALFPRGFQIERDSLVDDLIAEEIIKGRNRQVERERGQAMLNKLVNACLLQAVRDGDGRDYVKMHDLIRDMALQIAIENPLFLVKAGEGLKFVPDEEHWQEDLLKVSLMNNDISAIQLESPYCPTLSTLLLNGNRRLARISHNFFCLMKGLLVLNLSNTCIEYLPESVFELVNLLALLLRGCEKLKSMSSLENLTNLKKLDLCKSGIRQVPKGIEKLVKLRHLDLRCLPVRQCQEVKIRGEDLVPLRKLEILYCVLNSIPGFNEYIRSLEHSCLEHYTLQLGSTRDVQGFPDFQYNRTLRLAGYHATRAETITREDCKILLPADLMNIVIQSCKIEVHSLCDLVSFRDATNLRSCFVDRCRGVEHLFSNSSFSIKTLEVLNLYAAQDLIGIFRNRRARSTSRPPPGTFSSLKELRICRCDNIVRLYVTGPLPNLEIVVVRECVKMIELISTNQFVALHKLWKLHLEDLPNLITMPVIADSLQEVGIRGCPKLRAIPFLDRNPCPPSLQKVLIDDDMWESLTWEHPSAKTSIQSLRNLASQTLP